MSESIFEAFTDERGNISVRVSQEVQVLTNEEADRIAAEYKRIEAENAELRELVRIAIKNCDSGTCDGCPIINEDESCPYSDMARELGVEVDE